MIKKLNKMGTVLIWFQNNLRVQDQPLLAFSRFSSDQILPVFIIDERWFQPTAFGQTSMGPHRYRFLADSLRTLRRNLNALGAPLIVRYGYPEQLIPELCEQYKITTLRYQQEVGVYEQESAKKIEQQLIDKGVLINDYPIATLIEPSLFTAKMEQLPNQFTPFRQMVEKKVIIPEAVPVPGKLNGIQGVNEGHIPSAIELGLSQTYADARADLHHSGGEEEAINRLQLFIDSGAIDTYYDTRNQLNGSLFSSQLSPWLANGCISARTIYAAIKKHEQERGANRSTYWLFFELLWRDFFKFCLLKHGKKYFLSKGLKKWASPKGYDSATFNKWRSGTTTCELVNAAMVQLQATGYMSNRMRQVVASYLVNDLQQDWRWGAAWFEHWLIDYDVSSNYGNWTYLAGVGNDPRSDRYFDVEKQTRQFDKDYSFRNQWLTPDAIRK